MTTFAFQYFDGTHVVTSADITATTSLTRYSWTFTTPANVSSGAYVAVVDGSGDPTESITLLDVELNLGSSANPYVGDTPISNPGTGGGLIVVTNTAPAQSGFLRHYLGYLVPDSFELAGQMTNAQLFERYVPFPVSNPTYIGPIFDAGFTSSFAVSLTANVLPARGSTVAPVFATFLDSWVDGANDTGVFVPLTVGTVTGRFFRPMITLDTSTKAYISDFTMDLTSQSHTKYINSFAVSASGTLLSFPNVFHSPPNIQVTVIGGTATSGAASNVTSSSAIIELFKGELEVTGLCSITLVGG